MSLKNEYLTYLKNKEDLSDAQRDDYLEYFKSQFSKRLFNMIELINNN